MEPWKMIFSNDKKKILSFLLLSKISKINLDPPPSSLYVPGSNMTHALWHLDKMISYMIIFACVYVIIFVSTAVINWII